MKPNTRLPFFSLGFIALCCSAAQAQTNLIWDSNGSAAGLVGGPGNWGSTGRWWNGTANQNWVSGANALFGLTSGTVTIGNTFNVGSLGFDVGGYTLSGVGSINFIYFETNVISTTTGTSTIAVNLSGVGGFTKTGAGTLVLSGSNSQTGTIDVSAGTLRLAGGAAVADTAAITLANAAGAILDLNGSNETIASLAGGGTSGGNVTLGVGTLTTDGDALSSPYAGVISGNGGLTKIGGGVLTLSGANLFTGTTLISAGTLRLSGGAALADTSAVTFANTAGAVLDLNNTSETIGSLAGGGSSGGNVTLGSATLTIGADATTTSFAGGISGSGGITKIGAGALVLTGSNAFTGATTISVGALRVAGGTALADSSAVTLANTNGVLLDVLESETIGSLAGGGTTGGNVTLTGGTLTTGSNNSSSTFAGGISGSGSLTKTGGGVFTFTGTNSATGATTINGGTLLIGGGAAIGDASAVTLADTAGAILDLNGSNETIGSLAGGGASGGNITLGSATLTAGGNNANTTYAGGISGSGGITKIGAGALVLTGSNAFTGATTISAGTLRVAGGTALTDSSAVTLANTSGAILDLNGSSETIGSLAGGG
ncbi:MAG: autotransporter-associated beta strand repeat-containing protein, partial [Verrucomicrobiota bacterium]